MESIRMSEADHHAAAEHRMRTWPAFRIRSFRRPRQLGAVLAKSSQCQECMVKQYFRFQAGRSGNAGGPAPDPVRSPTTFAIPVSASKSLILSLVLLREFPAQEKQRLACRK